MNIPPTPPALIMATAAALLVTGCGGSSNTAPTPTAPTPTATMVGRSTPPVVGTTRTSGAKRARTIATGTHYHAGEFCSGRDQARYAGEGLICVTGRLKPKK